LFQLAFESILLVIIFVFAIIEDKMEIPPREIPPTYHYALQAGTRKFASVAVSCIMYSYTQDLAVNLWWLSECAVFSSGLRNKKKSSDIIV